MDPKNNPLLEAMTRLAEQDRHRVGVDVYPDGEVQVERHYLHNRVPDPLAAINALLPADQRVEPLADVWEMLVELARKQNPCVETAAIYACIRGDGRTVIVERDDLLMDKIFHGVPRLMDLEPCDNPSAALRDLLSRPTAAEAHAAIDRGDVEAVRKWAEGQTK